MYCNACNYDYPSFLLFKITGYSLSILQVKNAIVIGPDGRQSNSQPREVNTHNTATFLPHAVPEKKLRTGSPSEDGIQPESQHADFAIDGYLVPIPRSNRGH